MKKTLLRTLMIVLVFCLLTIPVGAQTGIMPLWDNLQSLDVDISFSGTAGNVTGITTRQTGVIKMEGTITLYEYVEDQWVYVDDWSNTTSRSMLGITGDFTAVKGREYKAVMTVTAYRDTGTAEETATQEVIKICP